MNFKHWVKVDNLLQRLVESGVDLQGIIEDTKSPGLVARLKQRFAKAPGFRQGIKDTWNAMTSNSDEPLHWLGAGYDRLKKGILGEEKPKKREYEGTLEDKFHARIAYLTKHGGYPKEVDALKAEFRKLMGSKGLSTDQTKKGKEAVATLRGILTDPKNAEILDSLEQQISILDKPDWYHGMTGNEKKWYDNLGDDQRNSFSREMATSGNKAINQGDEDWNAVASRANKSYNQGYQDRGANWNWAAGFTNRQRIRRNMDPNWANSLQGESFVGWLKRRVVEEDINNNAQQIGQLAKPTDPKEIARRETTNKIATNMMKSNKKLLPGKTDQQLVANSVGNNPELAKADPDIQQSVSNFFLNKNT